MGWSTGALVLANAVPLFGALLLRWNVREMLALYWSENVVVGAFTLLRLRCARHPTGPARAVAIPLTLFAVLAPLVAVKVAVDVAAHRTERRRLRAPQAAAR